MEQPISSSGSLWSKLKRYLFLRVWQPVFTTYFRWAFGITFLAIWIFILYSVSVGKANIGGTGVLFPQWAPASLGITILLFSAQIFFQALATRQVEYISMLLGAVLFVQSSTILAALLVSSLVRDTPKITSELTLLVVGSVISLLVLVLSQVQTLRWARDHIHHELGRIIFEAAIKQGLSIQVTQSLIATVNNTAPVDFYPSSVLSMIARYPVIWADIQRLVGLHGLPISDQQLDTSVRGLNSRPLQGAERLYWYSGALAAFIGSTTVVFGGLTL